MKKTLMLLIAALFSLFTSCGSDQYPELEDGLYAEFVTDHGTMVAELYYEQTPATVGNFVALVEGNHPMVTKEELKGKPFYDGLTFHRIIKGFMIQGGDPDGNGRGGPGYKFHDEFVEGLTHTGKGILSMANSGPNTNGSQFFICEKDTPWLNNKHTVWGKVVVGLDVIDVIANVKKDGNPQQGKPAAPVYMQTVRIIRKGSAAKAFDGAKTFQAELDGLEEKRAKAAAEKAKQFRSFKDAFDAKKAKAESFPSGLQMFWDKRGDGAKPAEGARVKVDYAGFFESGELFDTSIPSVAEAQDKIDPRRSYQPLETTCSLSARMIAGFNEAVMQLKVGDKATIFIPAHLAWGEQGSRGVIPPNSNVIFEVEIVEIMK